MRAGLSGGDRGRSGGDGRGKGAYTNPCLTMHQPWASLLVHGIKRIEGRSWPAPFTGRLWIHAASKVPDPESIKAMEDFYKEIYAVDGVRDIKFPEHYPVSRLLGCVEVVGCLKCEELICWEEVPKSVRLEGLTDFCWLCENPQKLLVPFEMRGYQRVYNLERKIHEAALRGLCPVQVPLPVKFPHPNPDDLFSLKPGSLSSYCSSSSFKSTPMAKTPDVNAAIAGARAAAAQFSKKHQATVSTSDNSKLTRKNEPGLAGSSRIEAQKEDKVLSVSQIGGQCAPAINYVDDEPHDQGRKRKIHFDQIATGFSSSESEPPGKVSTTAPQILNSLKVYMSSGNSYT